jgi:hypothetical protein
MAPKAPHHHESSTSSKNVSLRVRNSHLFFVQDGATPSRSISAHNDAVRGADCTRDIIVTGGNDTMVRVWRPKLKAK